MLMKTYQIPKNLQQGDAIGILSTARKITVDELNPAIKWVEKQGFNAVLGRTLTLTDGQFAGTAEQRAEDFQRMLENPNIKAIWCARGGYGTAQILDQIDFSPLRKNPKWVIGYSDVTALHSHIHNMGLATLHATMPINILENTPQALSSLLNVLCGQPNHYQWEDTQSTHTKQVLEGIVVGGNLSLLYSLLGSPSDIDTNGKILLLEDLDEYLYHIDRMMLNLKRNGKLKKLKALLVGSFTKMHDNACPYGKTVAEIILENTKDYDFPIVFDVPSGHIHDNRAFILGKKIKLCTDGKDCQILM